MRERIFIVFLTQTILCFGLILCTETAQSQQCGLPGLPPCPSKPAPKPTTPKKTTPKPTTSQPKPAAPKPVVRSKPQPQQPRFVARAPEIAMVRIPAGSFMMGSDKYEGEKPVHRVNINYSFYMGKYEVTQAQWRAVMGNNPSYFSNCGGNCPVEQVSWDDAQEFIRKLNNLQSDYEYRLPTEAEWEYAARAGSTTKYGYGDDESSLGDYAWYSANSGGKTHPVGQKQPNDWGLYDMHGNVWEWVQDWYGAYPSGTVADPTDASSGSDRVFRGGGWGDAAVVLRSAFRDSGGSPSGRAYYLGFRVVRIAP